MALASVIASDPLANVFAGAADTQTAAPALIQPQPVRPISSVQFTRICDLIKQRSGIHLTEAKQALLVGRLSRRLRANGLTDFGRYYELLCQNDQEVTEMLDCVSTNETYFF